MTASMDMFPRQLRRSGRRELLILAISVTCCLIGLFLVTEVSGRGGASPEVGGATRSSLLVLVSSPLVSGDRNQTQAGLSSMSLSKLREMMKVREVWRATVHGHE